jgi:hypothetical protein
MCRVELLSSSNPAPKLAKGSPRPENRRFHQELGGPMIVTDMPVESLVPYARTPPRNNTAAIDAMRASIAEFGFRQPIVVDGKLEAIVGHSRLEAALLKGKREIDSDQIH